MRKVISEKNSTLMKRILPNKCTKFGEEIFRRYRVITLLLLGHLLKQHPVNLDVTTDLIQDTEH